METIKGRKKEYFGKCKSNDELIYITKPQWNCDKYWSFGYLGNKNNHYFLSSYQNNRNINMYEALKEDYYLSDKINSNLWLFCELATIVYTLKETAEILERGGSYYIATNPLSKIIKNETEVRRINEIILPAIFNEVAKIYE
jgi:hypothetical protein